MVAGRDPVDRVIDLVIAVPVSLVAAARQLMPVRVSRLEQQVARDLDLVVRYARRAAPSLPRRSRRRTGVSTEPVTSVAPSQVTNDDAAAPAAVAPTAIVLPADDLPIEGYDQLSARQIVDRLGALTGPELALVERYEQQHRGRQTILLRIAQLT
jgi:hypothetical protein